MHHIIRERNHLSLEMAATPGFRLTAWLVFEQLTRWENSSTGYTQPGQGVIADAIRRSRKAVNEAVGWLRKHHYIKTRQRYVLHRDRPLFGTLRYWVAKELGQVEWLKSKWQRSRVEAWATTGLHAVRRETAIQATRHNPVASKAPWKAGAAGGESLSKDAREAYWLQQLGCNPAVSTPSSSELNTETLMSPALKKWLENDKRRR